MKEITKSFLQFSILVLAIIFLTYFCWDYIGFILEEPEKIREFVHSFGLYAPVIFILLFILQIILAPVPGQIIGTAGGYIFGFWGGFILISISLFFGSWLVFSLSKKFGRPFVEKIIKKEHLEKYDRTFKEKGKFVLFLIYLIPFSPHDALTFIAGMSDIKTKKFLLILMIARSPSYLFMSLIGSGIAEGNFWLSGIVFFIALILSIFGYIHRNKIEKNIFRIVNFFRRVKCIQKLKL